MKNNQSALKNLRRFYERNGLAQHDDKFDLKTGLKIDRILKYIKLTSNDILLDVGCATGKLLKSLPNTAKIKLGIDCSQKAIKKAEGGIFLIADAHHIPLKNEIVTKVVCFDVLEHVLDPKNVLQEIKRISKSSAEIVIEVPSRGLLAKIIFGEFHEGHLRYYQPHTIKEEAENVGFKVVSIEAQNSVIAGRYFNKYPSFFKALFRLSNIIPHSLYPYFGEIVVHIKKW
jgi:SAM-dependent methyltransferase